MIKTIIADDEPAVAEILMYFIQKNQMPLDIVGIAQDGNVAIEMIQKEKPKLVFLDIQMPHKNGFEVMQQCQAQGSTAFIIITAFESFEYAQQALRDGASDILLKPINYEQFTEALTRTVGWRFTDNTTVNGIIEYLYNHYNEKIDLTVLSQKYFSTPSQIARLFKKYTHCTIITYLHRIRIEKAVELLEKGISIKEVSFQTGYENLNHFYKYFKQFRQETPGDFIKHQ